MLEVHMRIPIVMLESVVGEQKSIKPGESVKQIALEGKGRETHVKMREWKNPA